MASKEKGSNIPLLLEAIEQHNTTELNRLLNTAQDSNITLWKDENSLDLIHHSILAENKEACYIFLWHFKHQALYNTSTWPYIHLAACLGNRDLLVSVIYKVRFLNDSIVLDWDIFERVIKPKIKTSIPELKPEDKKKKYSASDLATMFGYADCVYTLANVFGRNVFGRPAKDR